VESLTFPDMNPQIEAAWIAGASGLLGVLVGVGGTVTVAIFGFRNTRDATAATNKTTSDVLQAQIEAARRDKMYDKRAEVYVDYLSVAAWAQTSRQAWQRRLLEQDPGPGINKLLDSPPAADLGSLEARMQAYGTPDAFTASQKLGTANFVATAACTSWAAKPSDAGKTAALHAIEEADDASDELVQLVRVELTGDSTPLTDWQWPNVAG
jgi:hypothetical protein